MTKRIILFYPKAKYRFSENYNVFTSSDDAETESGSTPGSRLSTNFEPGSWNN